MVITCQKFSHWRLKVLFCYIERNLDILQYFEPYALVKYVKVEDHKEG